MSGWSAAAPRARRRDRRVYLASHPLLFALLALARSRPVMRVGRTHVVSGPEACREALTRLALDRTSSATTGGIARELLSGKLLSGEPVSGERASAELLFDQEGAAHRRARRAVGTAMSSVAVARLRPQWRAQLERRLTPLRDGATVDVVSLTAELAGETVSAMLDLEAAPQDLARAARDAAATAARLHLPGLCRRRRAQAARRAATRLTAMMGDDPVAAGPAAILAMAAVNTTVAGIPRAVAWCADQALWPHATDGARLAALVDELLRVTAPTPLLPRIAGADGTLAGRPVRAGDRLLLVARHAAGAAGRQPDAERPAPAAVAQLVFGAGPHSCPGAQLVRAQLADLLRALAPYRPVVVRARADRRAALPGWRRLLIRAGGPG